VEIKNGIAMLVYNITNKWNGSGYPRGLKGEQISNYAQIISAADVFSDLLVEAPGKDKCIVP